MTQLLPKAPTSKSHHTGIRVSTYEFGGDTFSPKPHTSTHIVSFLPKSQSREQVHTSGHSGQVDILLQGILLPRGANFPFRRPQSLSEWGRTALAACSPGSGLSFLSQLAAKMPLQVFKHLQQGVGGEDEITTRVCPQQDRTIHFVNMVPST